MVDDAESQVTVGYLDIDALEPAIEESFGASAGGIEAMDNIRPLRAFGFSATLEGEYQSATFRLSVDD